MGRWETRSVFQAGSARVFSTARRRPRVRELLRGEIPERRMRPRQVDSPRNPRVAAGSSAVGSRTVAGSRPVRAAVLATADLPPCAVDIGMSPDVASRAGRRVAPKPLLPSASLPPPASASAGLPLFCDQRLQRSFVQQQFGHGVLQLPVFLL